MIWAAQDGYKEIVELLIRHEGIDINIQDILDQKTFIIFKSNFLHWIEKLNDLWNLTQTFHDTALIRAAQNGHEEIVELLIKQKGINISIQDILNQKAFIVFKSNFF